MSVNSNNQFILTNINCGREITYKFEGNALYDVLPEFKEFLRGCGYYFDGELEIAELCNPDRPEEYYGEECGNSGFDMFDTAPNIIPEEPI